MDYFLKRYAERCKSEFSQYGFKRQRNTFVRVKNDVVQDFTLKRYRFGRVCTIEFGVIPLCYGIKYVDMGVYDLRRFGIVRWSQGGWEYDNNSQESMDVCIEELISHLKKYLMPFFDRANSCKTALNELIELEKHFNENRIAGLKKDGIKDEAKPGSEVMISDGAKFYMALKNGDYDFALISRRALLQQNMNAFASVKQGGFLTEEALKEREDDIEKLKSEIKRIEEKDEQYFQNLILENEANSRKTLKGII